MASPSHVGPRPPAAPAKSETASPVRMVLLTAIGAGLGVAISRSLPLAISVRLLGGAVMGTLVGLLPYFLAKRRGLDPLGKRALGWSALAGTAFGFLLAGPVALGFTLAILRRSE